MEFGLIFTFRNKTSSHLKRMSSGHFQDFFPMIMGDPYTAELTDIFVFNIKDNTTNLSFSNIIAFL